MRCQMAGKRGRMSRGPITAISERGNSEGQPCAAINLPPTPSRSSYRGESARSASISLAPSASPECSPAMRNSFSGSVCRLRLPGLAAATLAGFDWLIIGRGAQLPAEQEQPEFVGGGGGRYAVRHEHP